jgi:alkylation response protein AidB-like acyl-CoA dehydrogenase
MRREIFSDEHEHFRAEVRRFAQAEIVPHLDDWNQNGQCDRDIWRKMGSAGFLGANAPEEYGGGGVDIDSTHVIHPGHVQSSIHV